MVKPTLLVLAAGMGSRYGGEKQTDGMIHFKGTGQVQADANVQVSSGFLQASNVNAVEEMTAILSLSRQFELHVKMMRTAEDNDTAMARVLQFT